MALRRTMSIEQAVQWAYADQAVEECLKRASAWAQGPRDLKAQSYAGAGGGGYSMASTQVHADALTIAVAVDDLGPNARMAVRVHAKGRSVPDWVPWPRIRSVAGKHVIDPVTRRPSFCMVSFTGDLPEHVTMKRTIYDIWSSALVALRARLVAEGELVMVELDGVLPTPSPWCSSQQAA